MQMPNNRFVVILVTSIIIVSFSLTVAISYIVRAFNEMSSTGTPQTPPTTETVEPGYDIILVGGQSNAAGFPDDNGYWWRIR